MKEIIRGRKGYRVRVLEWADPSVRPDKPVLPVSVRDLWKLAGAAALCALAILIFVSRGGAESPAPENSGIEVVLPEEDGSANPQPPSSDPVDEEPLR